MNGTHSSTHSSRARRRSIRSVSSQPIEVIDLTESSPPPPRGPVPLPQRTPSRNRQSSFRDIIDVDSLPDLPPPPRRVTSQHPHVPCLPSEDITRGHDVVLLGEESSPQPPRGFPGGTPSLPRPREVTHYHYHIHQPQPLPTGGFVPPRRRRYPINAHHVYGDDTPLRDLPVFKDEAYQPPPPPRQGFTRSLTETMALVCPQCGIELGKNNDKIKKEVWVAKCGHTYCGSCAAGQRQNKGKGARATRCIVEGCTKIISGDKGMMEVFF